MKRLDFQDAFLSTDKNAEARTKPSQTAEHQITLKLLNCFFRLQCVVQFLLFKSPACANNKEPEQTEVVHCVVLSIF